MGVTGRRDARCLRSGTLPGSMARDLQPLFAPRSVAILGASNDPAKWGNWLARGALRGEHRRPVFLVNRNGGEVLGRTAYRVGRRAAGGARAGGGRRARGRVRAGGGRRAGRAGRGRSSASRPGWASRAARPRCASGRWSSACARPARCCSGRTAWACTTRLAISGWPPTSSRPARSGSISPERQPRRSSWASWRAEHGLGFSRFASIGNQADVDVAELVAAFAEHDGTELIAVYAEDFRDGRAFVDAAAGAGKPVVLLTVGRSAASARAAASHTGALVSDAAVVEAACRAAGAHLVRNAAEMIDLAAGAAAARPAGGPAGRGAGRRRRARRDRLRRARGGGLELPPVLRRARRPAGRPAARHGRHRQPGRPGRRWRAGLHQLRPPGAHDARVRGDGRRADVGLFRRLLAVLRGVRGRRGRRGAQRAGGR